MLDRKQLVSCRPGHERGLVKPAECIGGLERVARVDRSEQPRQVPPHAAVSEDILRVRAHDLGLDRVVGGPAVGDPQPLDPAELHGGRDQPQQARHPRGRLQITLRPRREAVERVARCEDERADALGAVAREPLRDRAARVVGDDGHVVQVERGQEVGQDPRQLGKGHFGVLAQRLGVRSEREVGRDAAVTVGEFGHHPTPEVAVHTHAMDEDDRWAAAALAVLDRPGGDPHGPQLSELFADRHAGGEFALRVGAG